MGNTAFIPTNQVNANATCKYEAYTVTSAITTGAATANAVAVTIYSLSTGIIYMTKGTSTGTTSLSTANSAIVITSAVFNPLSLGVWTGSINLQSTTAASRAVVVETVYLTWAST
jgi:hypothetical protein